LSTATVEGGVTIRARPKHTYLVFGAEGAALYMRIGKRDAVVPEGMIGIIPPGVPYRLYLPRGGCRTLMLEMEPDFLESVLAEEIRADLVRPLNFAGDAGTHGAGERHFLELLKHVRDQLAQGAPQFRNSSYVTKLEQLLASALVHSAPHNYSGRLDAINDPAEPRFVRRAVDFIHAHAGEPITLPAIAQSAAVSLRKLFRGFHTYRNCTPAAYLRSVRLERCHQDLLRAMPGEVSVTTVASRWGFSNAGRFAFCYRERFGENPAETLRRKAHP
jgi:AraC-like DNA-binding protein